MFRNVKIGTRLILSSSLLILVAVAVITAVSGLRVHELATRDGQTIAEQTARRHAASVGGVLDRPLVEARSLARAFEAFAASEALTLEREAANDLLRHLIEHSPDLLGVYVAFEPDAFDGRDRDYAGSPGHDATGRFVPYWVRDERGRGVSEALVGYDQEGDGDYYQVPRRYNRESIIDPYAYEIQGADVLLTSIVVPVRNVRGEFIGIAGVDLALDSLQETVRSIEIDGFEAAYVTFFASDGTVVGSQIDGEVARHVSQITDSPEYIRGVERMRDFTTTRQSHALGEEVLTYAAAIDVGDTGSRWMVTVNLPTSELYAGSRTVIGLIILIGAVTVIALVVLMALLARSISRPILLIVEGADRLATGDIKLDGMDLDAIGKVNRRGDELGRIGRAFTRLIEYQTQKVEVAEQIAGKNLRVEPSVSSDQDQLGKAFVRMVASLNETLSQVQSAADQVAAAAGQVSSASQDLSQGATESASSLEEITSSINEIAGQSRQTMDGSSEANTISRQSAVDAKAGQQQMGELRRAMESISEGSGEISRIVKVIDDIAFQINLLALNANVEAARAGKYGKGFAVVAEEVRNLAVRAAEAVKETESVVGRSVSSIEAGGALTVQTAEHLDGIVSGAERVSHLLEELAAASREQAIAIEQMTEGLGQVDQVTQSNTASAEESASASEELSSQAEQLRAAVAVFALTADRGQPHAEGSAEGANSLFSHAGNRAILIE